MDEREVNALIEKRLSGQYVVIARRDLLPYSFAATAVLAFMGLGTWEVAKRSAIAAIEGEGGRAALAEIDAIRDKAKASAAFIASDVSFLELFVDSRVAPIVAGLDSLYSDRYNSNLMENPAYAIYVRPAHQYYVGKEGKYVGMENGTEFPRNLKAR